MSADRVRRHRERRRRGLRVFRVELPEADLEDALVAGRWLAPWQADDAEAVEAALAAALAHMIRNGNA